MRRNIVLNKSVRNGLGFGGGLTNLASSGFKQSSIGYIGKGIREPVSPFRLMNVWGEALNAPSAYDWNALPEIVSPQTNFDMSVAVPYTESVCALFNFTDITAPLTANFQWVRESDNKVIFSMDGSIPDPASYGFAYWGFWYFYTYIGFVPWEIASNGRYHVTMTVNNLPYNIFFNVTGVPANVFSGTLSGLVTDTGGNPIPDVTVNLGGTVRFTNSGGAYSFENIVPNIYSLTFSKTGYTTVTI